MLRQSCPANHETNSTSHLLFHISSNCVPHTLNLPAASLPSKAVSPAQRCLLTDSRGMRIPSRVDGHSIGLVVRRLALPEQWVAVGCTMPIASILERECAASSLHLLVHGSFSLLFYSPCSVFHPAPTVFPPSFIPSNDGPAAAQLAPMPKTAARTIEINKDMRSANLSWS